MALALRAAAQGVYHAHLERCMEHPGPGHTDLLMAADAATRYLTRARSQAQEDLAQHRADLHAAPSGATDAATVYLLTLVRKLGSYEDAQRRSKEGQVRAFHGVLALQLVEGADTIIMPDIPAQAWARRSPVTARVMQLGKILPRLAAKAHQYGRRLVCAAEEFTTGGCPHCALFERRGSKLFIECTGCGLASHRDGGMAPNGIWKRALVHGAEALQGMLAAAAGGGTG
jgi:hypothetical protein